MADADLLTRLRTLPTARRDELIDQILNDHLMDLVNEDAVASAMACTNAVGFDVDGHEVTNVDLSHPEQASIEFTFTLTGEQDPDRTFCGDTITGSGVLIVSTDGDSWIEQVGASVEDYRDEDDFPDPDGATDHMAATPERAPCYVPILKFKAGERKALVQLRPQHRAAMLPVLEILSAPVRQPPKKQPAKPRPDYITECVDGVKECWDGRRVLIDFSLFKPKPAPISPFFDQARAAGIQAIPVVWAGEVKNADIAHAVATDHRGIGLRIGGNAVADIPQHVNRVIADYGLTVGEIDLIVDLGAVTKDLGPTIVLGLIGLVATVPAGLRTFALASSAFPASLAGIKHGDTIVRSDWKLWTSLLPRIQAPLRRPIFGDYAIAFPDLSEFDPKLMSVSAALRYTTDTDWLILKGPILKKDGAKEMPRMLKWLTQQPVYKGAGFSAGDADIDAIANLRQTTGNPTTWRRIGTNHHLTLVVEQLTQMGL